MTAERWLPIPGYEGSYEVSDLGRVRSLTRTGIDRNGRQFPIPSRVLKPVPARRPWGHLQVGLAPGDGRPVQLFRVHRLVLAAFVGHCPDGMQCCHANDDPTDNRLVNLRWDTPVANAADKRRNRGLYQERITHCPHGHAYTPENTYVKQGARRCRQCLRRADRARRARLAVSA